MLYLEYTQCTKNGLLITCFKMMGSVSQSGELIHALHSIHAVMSHIHLHSITMFSVVKLMYVCPTYQDCAQTASHLYNLYRTQAESFFSHMAS